MKRKIVTVLACALIGGLLGVIVNQELRLRALEGMMRVQFDLDQIVIEHLKAERHGAIPVPAPQRQKSSLIFVEI